MRRSAWSRALSGLWGLWFVVVLSAPTALQPCPLHADHAGQSHGGHAHGAHVMHGGTMPASHSNHPAHCDCLGLCCCVATPGILPAAVASFVRPTTTTVAGAPLAHVRIVASERAYAHPFANGPPPSRSLIVG